MPISDNVGDREHSKFVESVAVPGKPVVAVTNPDGSNIGGSGGTSMLDDSAFTPAGSSVTPAGAMFDDVSPDQVDEGDVGVIRMTQLRALHVNLRDNTGAEVSPGGGTQYDEDTPSAAAEKLTMAGVVRKDTATSLVDLDGDRTELQVDGTGLLRARLDAALPAGTANIGKTDARLRNAADSAYVEPATDRATAAAPFSARLSDGAAFYDTAKTGQLPTALVGGRLDVNTGAWLGSTAPTVGQKTMANSVPAVLASDQSALNVKTNTGDEVATVRTTLDPVDGAGTAVTIKFARINATADGDNTVVAAVGGKKIRVLGYVVTVTAAGTISLQDTAATPVIHAQFSLAAQGGVSYAGGLDAPAFETAVGTGVEINNPAGVDTLGHMTYVEL